MKNVNHKAQSTVELEKYLSRPQIKKMQVSSHPRTQIVLQLSCNLDHSRLEKFSAVCQGCVR